MGQTYGGLEVQTNAELPTEAPKYKNRCNHHKPLPAAGLLGRFPQEVISAKFPSLSSAQSPKVVSNRRYHLISGMAVSYSHTLKTALFIVKSVGLQTFTDFYNILVHRSNYCHLVHLVLVITEQIGIVHMCRPPTCCAWQSSKVDIRSMKFM